MSNQTYVASSYLFLLQCKKFLFAAIFQALQEVPRTYISIYQINSYCLMRPEIIADTSNLENQEASRDLVLDIVLSLN